MAAIDVVRARIDPAVKKEASEVLASLGLTISDAIRLLLVRIAAEKALPFEVRVPDRSGQAAARAATGRWTADPPEPTAVKKPPSRSLGDLLPDLGGRQDGRSITKPAR